MIQRIILSLVHIPKACQTIYDSPNPSKIVSKLSRIPRILLDVQNTLGNQILRLGTILDLMLQAIGTHVSLEFFGVSLKGGSRVDWGKNVP